MPVLSEHEVFIFISELGVIILLARIFAEISVRLGQPVLVGEVIAGIFLGPAFFGRFLPTQYSVLFPANGHEPYLLQGISWLCVLFLLLITGLEIDFRASIRQGASGIYISLLALIVAFVGVYAAGAYLPTFLFPEGVDPVYVRLLLASGLSVTAIPVIAKILFDLKILKSEVGLRILTSGVLSDVWGWTLLAVIITLISKGTFTLMNVLKPLLTMIVYLTVTLSFGQKMIDKFLDAIGYKKMDAPMALSLLFALALLNGAIAHLLGIHVIFGAFVAGIMAGESTKVTPYMRQWLQDFIFGVFAPIFFVLIGMQLDFSDSRVWIPMFFLLTVASVTKIGGAFLGGILGGLGKRNSLVTACGLNTQGTMGIIVGLIGYELGIFNDAMFAIIVIICVLTSLGIGPLLMWTMQGVKRPLAQFFKPKHVFLDLEGKTKKSVIKNMALAMKEKGIIKDEEYIEKSIWEREEVLSTAIGDGVALPHARIPNLKKPVLCFFRLKTPIDFESPDNQPVQLLFLELTDKNDEGMQLNLIAQVARFISSEKNRERLITSKKEDDIYHLLSLDEHA